MTEQTSIRKDRVMKKIKSLLAKTTENGATEAEAIAALEKAKQLMLENMIAMSDLKSETFKDGIVIKKVQVRHKRSIYDFTRYCTDIAHLFDCETYYLGKNNHIIYFMGLEEDVELSMYFAKFITDVLLQSIREYRSSAKYKEFKQYVHGRILLQDFSKGFINTISLKLKDMYHERWASRHQGIIEAKSALIHEAFVEKFPNMNYVNSNRTHRYHEGFTAGIEKGLEVEIVQGLTYQSNDQNQQQSILGVEQNSSYGK